MSVCSWECVFVLMWARLWACLLMNACAGIWTCVQVACESGLLGLCSQMYEPAFFSGREGAIFEYCVAITSGGSASICGLLEPGPRIEWRGSSCLHGASCVFT